MSIVLYQQYLEARKQLPPCNGRIMAYGWGNLPKPVPPAWTVYSLMFEEHSGELANAINAFTSNLRRLEAWSAVVPQLSDYEKMEVSQEFTDAIAINAMNAPYMLRSRFWFATAHLCHQANMARDPAQKDDLPSDECIYQETADLSGRAWRKYGAFKRRAEKISGKAHKLATGNFRHTYNHRFSQRFVVGRTGLVTRTVDKKTSKVSYVIGDSPPLQLDSIARILMTERDNCYLAFDAFQALVREHEASVPSVQAKS
jgi:hypothetical protein